MVLGWRGEKFANVVRHDKNCSGYDINVRQLLHVGYKIAAEMGDKYIKALEKHEDLIAECVTENIFERHIKPLMFS